MNNTFIPNTMRAAVSARQGGFEGSGLAGPLAGSF